MAGEKGAHNGEPVRAFPRKKGAGGTHKVAPAPHFQKKKNQLEEETPRTTKFGVHSDDGSYTGTSAEKRRLYMESPLKHRERGVAKGEEGVIVRTHQERLTSV